MANFKLPFNVGKWCALTTVVMNLFLVQLFSGCNHLTRWSRDNWGRIQTGGRISMALDKGSVGAPSLEPDITMGVSGQPRHAVIEWCWASDLFRDGGLTKLILFVVGTMNVYEKVPNAIPPHSSVHRLVFNPNNKCELGSIISVDENVWA